jgi:hypothetical protein
MPIAHSPAPHTDISTSAKGRLPPTNGNSSIETAIAAVVIKSDRPDPDPRGACCPERY